MSNEVAVTVTLYKGSLVFNTIAEKSIPQELVIPGDGNDSFGVVVMNLKLVGVSREAYDEMKKLRPGRDAIGQLDCWETSGPGDWAFGFVGLRGLVKLDEVNHETTSRSWRLAPLDQFTIIENVSPEGAMLAIDEYLSAMGAK